MIRILIVAALLAYLSGCSSAPKEPETRVVCTINRDRAFTMNVLKRFGLGYGFELAASDRDLICAAPVKP